MYKPIVGYNNSYLYFAKIEISDPKKENIFIPTLLCLFFLQSLLKAPMLDQQKILQKFNMGTTSTEFDAHFKPSKLTKKFTLRSQRPKTFALRNKSKKSPLIFCR